MPFPEEKKNAAGERKVWYWQKKKKKKYRSMELDKKPRNKPAPVVS